METRVYIDKTEQVNNFRALRTKAGNQTCFDCGARMPTWASVTYELDKWTAEEMRLMQLGGNEAARQFFKEKGWTDLSAKIDEKYTSRAAKMYRQQLAKLAGSTREASKVSFESDEEDVPVRAGLTRQKSDVSAPLHSEFISSTNAQAVSDAYEAEKAEIASSAPVSYTAFPTSPATAYSAQMGRKHHPVDAKDDSGVSLDVSAVSGAPSTATTTTAPEVARKPIVVVKTGGSTAGKLGAKKLGASKLGAATVATAAKPGFDDFDKEKAEAAAPVATSDDADARLAKALKDLELQAAASKAESTKKQADGASLAKFQNSKGISSDMLFPQANAREVSEANMKLSSYSGARAISSDMIYGGGRDEGDRFAQRAGSGADGLSEFMEKLGSAVGDDLRKVTGNLSDKAGRLKEGVSAFMEAIRR